MIIGTNWFLGYSHTSLAKDKFIKAYQTRQSMSEIICVFLEAGVDTIMGPMSQLLEDAIQDAEQSAGQKVIRILTPSFSVRSGEPDDSGAAFDQAAQLNATFCMPHQCVTDALIDLTTEEIRNIGRYTGMIRERGMIPGLSTHTPQAVVIADKTNADVETYIQIYNAEGFLMQVEVDWVMRVIANARRPVMTIKPMAAGRLLPPVGLAFAWNTIRDQDMVTVGTTTPDEAREVIELSVDFLSRRMPQNLLQRTRSKKVLV
jgi:hypothetical protein